MRLVRGALLLLAILFLVASAIARDLWRKEPLANIPLQHFDAILVLGHPCRKDGSPSAEQRERVLEAVRQWRRGIAPRILVSGGAAHNHWVEADSMAHLAEQQGVPAADILEERQSLNTIQNVYYSTAILKAHGWKSVEVVSSWSHIPRATLILEHFPLLWHTDVAPWPHEYSRLHRAALDLLEADYCLRLRLLGFTPSRFISR
jgi:uncharacterized SAM-binding protein YcdF (DUF218 family)